MAAVNNCRNKYQSLQPSRVMGATSLISSNAKNNLTLEMQDSFGLDAWQVSDSPFAHMKSHQRSILDSFNIQEESLVDPSQASKTFVATRNEPSDKNLNNKLQPRFKQNLLVNLPTSVTPLAFPCQKEDDIKKTISGIVGNPMLAPVATQEIMINESAPSVGIQ